MQKKNYTSKLIAVSVMVIMMLCAAPVLEHFGIDVGVSAHAAKSGYYTYTVSGGKATITKVDSSISGNVTIPDKLGGYPVTTIASQAFGVCEIGTLTLGANISLLYDDTFFNAYIQKFKVNSNNTYFSSDSFGCLYLKGKNQLIRYPIGNTSTTSFSLSDGIETISVGAFANAIMLQEISLPESVESIGAAAFANCLLLKKINLPDSVTSIEDSTFINCCLLSEITIPSKCVTIGKFAFNSCISLKEVTIPESVNYIGDEAFAECMLLEKVIINSKNVVLEDNSVCVATVFLRDSSQYTNFLQNYVNMMIYYVTGNSETEIYKEYNNECNKLIVKKDYSPHGMIYCHLGSTAETYAKNNDITYTYLSNSSAHTHSLTELVVPSTCTEQGGRMVMCTECDYIASYEIYNLAAHTYKNKTTKATTSSNGKIVKACTVCGDVKSSKTIYKINSIKLSKTSYTYNGKAKTPSVTVKDSKGNVLVKDTDYTVTYASGRKAVGTYNVKIKFKGNYSGSKTLKFNIVIGKTNNVVQNKNKQGIYLSWDKVSGATGYELYQYKSNKWTKIKTLSSNYFSNASYAGSAKLKVRAYYKDKNGNIHYGNFSEAATYNYVLAQVKNLKQTTNVRGLKFTWTSVTDATGYQIQEYKNGKWTDLVPVSSNYNKNYIHNSSVKNSVTVRVRAYRVLNGKTYYGIWSTTATFKGK